MPIFFASNSFTDNEGSFPGRGFPAVPYPHFGNVHPGDHPSFGPFAQLDLIEVALFDVENIVRVKLNNKDNPLTGPKPLENLDFNTYGGIYRNVWLIAKNPLHITDPIYTNKAASGGIFVTYPKVSKEEATIPIGPGK